MIPTALLKTRYKKYNLSEYSDYIISPTLLQSQNKDNAASLVQAQNISASITASTSSQICKICNTDNLQ